MRKRSKYKPKGVRLDAVTWVVAGMKKITDLPDTDVALRIRNHDALTAVVQGRATKAEADVLIAAFNMAEALPLVNPAFGVDWKPEIREGQDALLSMCRRGVKTGRFVFTGPELKAVQQAMEVHDAQLDAMRVSDMEKALDIVENMVRSKRAIRIYEGVAA